MQHLDDKNFRPPNSTTFQVCQCFVGIREGIGLHLRPDRYGGGKRQELCDILVCHVRNRLDLFLKPEMVVITQVEEVVLVSIFLANGVDNQSSAGTEVCQCLDDRFPGGGRI